MSDYIFLIIIICLKLLNLLSIYIFTLSCIPIYNYFRSIFRLQASKSAFMHFYRNLKVSLFPYVAVLGFPRFFFVTIVHHFLDLVSFEIRSFLLAAQLGLVTFLTVGHLRPSFGSLPMIYIADFPLTFFVSIFRLLVKINFLYLLNVIIFLSGSLLQRSF